MIRNDLFAQDLMTQDVVTVRSDLSVTALARLLAERGISCVPVTAPSGELVGIVSEADLLRRLAAEEDEPIGWIGRCSVTGSLRRKLMLVSMGLSRVT